MNDFKNNTPEIVKTYVETTKEILLRTSDFVQNILKSEFIDENELWSRFELKALENYAVTGNPALNISEFEALVIETMQVCMSKRLKDLK